MKTEGYMYSKSFIYCTGTGHCPSTSHSYIKVTHCINGTIQKKKDSRSYFQGLLFVFEYSIVIISSHLFNRKDSHTTKTDLHCCGIFNTWNSESCLCSSIVYTLQFNT